MANERARLRIRSIRVHDDLWNAAQKKAGERGERLSSVIRRALENYVRRK